MKKGECPACYFEITCENPEVSEVIFCNDCGATLEITNIANGHITFKIAEEISEDWGE